MRLGLAQPVLLLVGLERRDFGMVAEAQTFATSLGSDPAADRGEVSERAARVHTWSRRRVALSDLDAEDLVHAAMHATASERPADLARLLDFEKPAYGGQKIGRWLKGTTKPSYEQTIKLLELAGWLDLDSGRANRRRRAGDDDRALRVLRELAPALADLASRVSHALVEQSPGRDG